MVQDKARSISASDDDRRSADPRRARTREAILQAGFKLFAAREPHGVSMDELVRAAAVSKQSFYNHFKDKDDLARHLLQIELAELDDLVTQANAGVTDAAQRISVGLCVHIRQALDHPERGWVRARLVSYATSTESDMNRPLAEDVRLGLTSGRLACFTPEIGVAFVVSAALAMSWRVLTDGTEAKALAVTPQFVTLMLRAFGLPPIEAELIACQATERIVRRHP